MARLPLSVLGACRASAAACILLACLNGCGGDVLNLGTSRTLSLGGDAGSGGSAGSSGSGNQGGTETLGWQNASLVLSHPSDENLSFANGTLTSVPNQATQLYFTEQLRGDPKSIVKRAEQSDNAWSTSSDLSFGGEVVDDASSPAISLAGHQLWFGSRREGSSNTDIWFCTGAGDTWSVPVKVAELSSEADDAPRQPAVKGSIMPLSSKRHGGKYQQIYFAQRDSENSPWREPAKDFLGTINSPDYESGDGFLTDDGLTLYFSSTRAGSADLYRAHRASLDSPFGEPQALEGVGINSPDSDERDPWLRESDQQLFFSSNRSEVYEIYTAIQSR
jgi:hypothetical protein